jgi:RNA polymerase sigma factor (sigma-70 family)
MISSRAELELLVLRAQAGERAALDDLVGCWHGALRRQVQRHVADPELVRDAVQDAWCAIVRGLRRLDDPGAFAAWTLRVAAGCATDLLRRRGRIARSEAAAAVEHAATAAATDGGSDGERIRRAVQALDRDHRVVVELFYLEGLSVFEVAGVLGLSPGTVKSRLFHARSRLRAQWCETDSMNRSARP